MFSERLFFSVENRAAKNTDIENENLALEIIRQIQLFPYDNSIKCKGLSTYERIQQTRQVRRGTCTTKHELLAMELRVLGFEVAYLTYPFYWQELGVNYPDHLLRIVDEMPMQYHLALGIINKGKFEVLDVTWDPMLKKGGFPLGTIDIQISSTPLAVRPSNSPRIHFANEERERYIDELKHTIPWSQTIPKFYSEFNEWLKTLRTS